MHISTGSPRRYINGDGYYKTLCGQHRAALICLPEDLVLAALMTNSSDVPNKQGWARSYLKVKHKCPSCWSAIEGKHMLKLLGE